ncbi:MULTISPECIES: preprotein translocase subunit SecA [unclassified Mycolicibacterium]|uniref:preprotein translocase subunit SecA n=1 Tax=unclassified Mycolicibacterium TaxID=2636767 RepID=UPI0013098D71|nr:MULTISPECIES: preprotein translocase subunit SecA [unclassified Mycolicibacterium]MUL81010.1 preprotein translocase subunit SecA [Mycolicibacterium sp. CBMA 329]MUL86776.1 preprotein translocase subunit SecA [Mycolicibacterium sp. CBMA 331]MUL98939.1 preprotein translocase subunit SecA [Mycolicibacterium sp. CBMA 334]MUM28815.1 preprotein translocase subunit SecA [Mycolicibacterium sp. CBMA 295]MUM37073.1 preprotein translocase subunit SecA [Mycolicibacterium sp. CBMA 247]
MLSKLLRLGEGRMVKRLKKVADYVETLSDDVEKLSDAELRAKTDEFKKRIAGGEELDDLLPEAFAVAREAAWRVLSQRHFEVQIMGGAALHFGNVAEMKTGEGKTLTAVLPAYLNALSGEGVHVVTVNDYLAKRDSEWMGRVHRFLGLDVGVILSGLTPDERRVAYGADITYGTNNEFGFDYLRDNMAHSTEDMVQRGHNFAIVDEVDSILIDEARTPLIISGPADGASNWYSEFARLSPLMKKDVHYEVDIKKRTIGVHEVGVEFVEDQLGIENLYEAANSPLVSYLNNAIKAKELFERDKEYIVRNGEVLIVDEFTGRVLIGRRYNEGMHQAIEAKEHVEIKAENQTLATITLQNYFRLYHKLSGMTGTAETEAAELHEIYKLGVVPIPTNRPMVRADQSDLIYKTEEAKYIAVVDDVSERYEKGQPVLIGTTSVERSEYLSRQFAKRKIPHNVLNAKYHEQEANIIAEAGRLGAITVATNMAGRGTDIVLGGNADFLADKRLRDKGLDPVETPEEYEAAWDATLTTIKDEAGQEAEKVVDAGGLYVLGTERHESRRIDNQLRGRSGRQGDPGESRFYLSLGDELMRRFNGATLESLLTRLNLPDDVPIEAKMVTRAIKSAQTQVEQQNFEVRKNVLKYDEVMNQQRKVIYKERRMILEGENLQEQAHDMLVDVITAYADGATAEGYAEDWDLAKLWDALKTLYPVGIDHHDLVDSDAVGEPGELTRDELLEALVADADRAYAEREKQLEELAGEGAMRQLERNVLLNVIDRKWREHLYEMDYLKEGIGLRAMAQRDPLVEYQREGYDMFVGMLDALKEESVGFLFNVQVEAAPAPAQAVGPVAAPSGLAEFAAAAAAQAGAAQAGAATAADPESGAVATKERPDGAGLPARPAPALRAKGIDNEAPQLTYTGPSEDGNAEVQRSGGAGRHSAASGGTRRERREAARKQAKTDRPSKSHRKS